VKRSLLITQAGAGDIICHLQRRWGQSKRAFQGYGPRP
jgi:hypothetical protein